MNPDQIKYSLQKKELQLSFTDITQHYSVVIFFGLVSLSILYLFIQNYLVTESFTSERGLELTSFFVLLIFTSLLYKTQKSGLQLDVLSTNLSSEEVKTAILNLARNNNWNLYSFEDLIVISTSKEKSIILFDKENVLLTGFFDPDSLGFLFRIFGKLNLLNIIENELRN